MGRYDDEPNPHPMPPLGESASAISLHPQDLAQPTERYFDDDPTEFQTDDLPPLYSDVDPEAASSAPASSVSGSRGRGGATVNPLLPSGADLKVQPFARDASSDTAYYVDPRLSSDPDFLADHIGRLAALPPRPYVHVRGTHTTTVRKSDGKSERRTAVDFDLQLELTYLLYEDIHAQRAWRHLAAAGNFDKVRRGTVFPTRAPGFGGSSSQQHNEAEEGISEIALWCHRYCASRAGLRAFALDRQVLGWDFDLIRSRLESLIRATNYRGHITIDFPVKNARVEVYNDCRTNRWRLTKWIEMLFVFTLLFLFSWPWLFFRTARWEVLTAQWHMSTTDPATGQKRYVSMSEERWYNLWARPIQKAILERRQGTLDQRDLDQIDAPPAAPPSGFAGVVQAGVDAMGVVNRSFGWGGDS
jgi:hypothetical protein